MQWKGEVPLTIFKDLSNKKETSLKQIIQTNHLNASLLYNFPKSPFKQKNTLLHFTQEKNTHTHLPPNDHSWLSQLSHGIWVMLKSIQLTDVLFTLPPDDAWWKRLNDLGTLLVDWRAGGAAPGDVRKGSSQGSPGFMLPWLCVGKDPYFIFKSQRVTLEIPIRCLRQADDRRGGRLRKTRAIQALRGKFFGAMRKPWLCAVYYPVLQGII